MAFAGLIANISQVDQDMSTAQARVVSIEAHSVKVSVAEQSACGGCRSKSACGVGTTREVPVDTPLLARLHVGDQVEIQMPTGLTLRLVTLIYAPPIAGFMLGILLSSLASASDGQSLASGVLGLAAGFVVTRLASRLANLQANPEIRIL
jgi:sigma-E factor negative regulatory protein RseC